MISGDVLSAAKVIWQYHQLGQTPVPGDVILALGTNDLRVAEFAAELYLKNFGRLLVCTGGIAHQGDLLQTPWERTEAEMYADIAIQRGVPREQLILEPRATNTAENFRFSRALLKQQEVRPTRIVIAVKPFMQRRAAATLAVEWPGMPATFTSPALTLEEYFTPELPAEKILHIMMGDLQRIWIYGDRGWSEPQQIPPEVLEAFAYLKSRGFTEHLVAER